MKKNLLFLLILVWVFWQITQGYFGDKYFCEIQKTKIQVTLQASWNKMLCTDLMQRSQQQINGIQKEIDTVKSYLRVGWPRNYREPVQKALEIKKQKTQNVKDQIIRSMNNFEFSLFVRLRKLIVFSFKPTYEELQKTLTGYDQQFKDIQSVGVVTDGDTLRKNYNDTYYKSLLLSKIFAANNFSELIPMITNYLAYDPTQILQFSIVDLAKIEQQLVPWFSAIQSKQWK